MCARRAVYKYTNNVCVAYQVRLLPFIIRILNRSMVGGPLTQNSSSYHYICCRFLCSPLICLSRIRIRLKTLRWTLTRLPIDRRMARRQII